MEEVLDAYGITQEDTRLYEVTGRGGSFLLEGYESFDEKTDRILFQFRYGSDS